MRWLVFASNSRKRKVRGVLRVQFSFERSRNQQSTSMTLSGFYSYWVDTICSRQLIQNTTVVDTYEIPADFQGEAMTITGYGVFAKKNESRLVLWARGNWIFRDIIKRHSYLKKFHLLIKKGNIHPQSSLVPYEILHFEHCSMRIDKCKDD